MSITQSRNKREGKYVGHVKGFAWRSYINYPKTKPSWYNAWDEIYTRVGRYEYCKGDINEHI